MERKIFNSDNLRLKRDLWLNSDYWTLRSADSFQRSIACPIDGCGYICYAYVFDNHGIIPVCTI